MDRLYFEMLKKIILPHNEFPVTGSLDHTINAENRYRCIRPFGFYWLYSVVN